MTDVWHIPIPDEARTRLLAEVVATKLAAGDMITLRGDLGVGKTTFARHLIRALLGDAAAEVPSPTFTLVQTYEMPRFPIRHFDLYRIASADDLHELEFDDADGETLTIVEWPERAADQLGHCRLDIMIRDRGADNEDAREIAIAATPAAAGRLSRMRAAYDFVCEAFNIEALAALHLSYLQGDASTRSYARVRAGSRPQLLMDMPKQPDGPTIQGGKTYSEIAHLAEDARPFVAIASALSNAGLSVPSIDAFDQTRGLALIEDFGDLTFAAAMRSGVLQAELWHAAVDVLVHLRRFPPSPEIVVGGDVCYTMPSYDANVMHAEMALLGDWYWPHVTGKPIDARAHSEFSHLWAPLIDQVATRPDNSDTSAWVLRDFHSPNLLWMPQRDGLARVGVIDFQDAQIGHAAYDLVSLALDARLDVSRDLHEALLDAYCEKVGAQNPGFDDAAFRRAAAVIGAQRSTKLLGIFARLSRRDGKHDYLQHIPRSRRYLDWCLAHPELADLKAWYDANLPSGAT
ncbi:MAG: tRNA (adenosine(37)-N6)-threonylcarbamoyltransferase complex ATPase subunit type 1 TsaE [Hyphomicrobiaceae bacterium]